VNAATFFTRWRVRLGYPLAIVVLALARPTPKSILAGGLVGAIGLMVRALAAGYLQKQQVLTVSGPYAFTRNPLYFGSAILALGAAIATRSWISGAILCGYFTLFYTMVMRREEQELRLQHGAAFDAYAKAVPLFLPRLTFAKSADASAGGFSFRRYAKNREYRASIGFLLLLALLLMTWRLRLA
jgi:protein-S-isoprenylcysteine O-methyltransferase Ste14